MPEQQSFVLYIVVGIGSKSGSRLPKTAPGAVFKVRIHGSLATGHKNGSWPPTGEVHANVWGFSFVTTGWQVLTRLKW